MNSLSNTDTRSLDKDTEDSIDSTGKRTHPLSSLLFALKASRLLQSRELRLKISIDDSWADIYKQGMKSVEIIRIYDESLLVQQGENLMTWLEDLADSSDQSYMIPSFQDFIHKNTAIGLARDFNQFS